MRSRNPSILLLNHVARTGAGTFPRRLLAELFPRCWSTFTPDVFLVPHRMCSWDGQPESGLPWTPLGFELKPRHCIPMLLPSQSVWILLLKPRCLPEAGSTMGGISQPWDTLPSVLSPLASFFTCHPQAPCCVPLTDIVKHNTLVLEARWLSQTSAGVSCSGTQWLVSACQDCGTASGSWQQLLKRGSPAPR